MPHGNCWWRWRGNNNKKSKKFKSKQKASFTYNYTALIYSLVSFCFKLRMPQQQGVVDKALSVVTAKTSKLVLNNLLKIYNLFLFLFKFQHFALCSIKIRLLPSHKTPPLRLSNGELSKSGCLRRSFILYFIFKWECKKIKTQH